MSACYVPSSLLQNYLHFNPESRKPVELRTISGADIFGISINSRGANLRNDLISPSYLFWTTFHQVVVKLSNNNDMFKPGHIYNQSTVPLLLPDPFARMLICQGKN